MCTSRLLLAIICAAGLAFSGCSTGDAQQSASVNSPPYFEYVTSSNETVRVHCDDIIARTGGGVCTDQSHATFNRVKDKIPAYLENRNLGVLDDVSYNLYDVSLVALTTCRIFDNPTSNHAQVFDEIRRSPNMRFLAAEELYPAVQEATLTVC